MKTPMTNAILELFGNLADELAIRQVPAGAIHAYIFGGSAVHLLTQSRASSDVDVEFEYAQIHKTDLVLVLKDLPPVFYEDPDEGPSRLDYDSTFNTTLGPLHEGYMERSVCIERSIDSPIVLWLPSPEDIALSKLGRLGGIDLCDILSLLDLPQASWTLFEQLAIEASAYYVGPSLTSNLAYVKKKWTERRSL